MARIGVSAGAGALATAAPAFGLAGRGGAALLGRLLANVGSGAVAGGALGIGANTTNNGITAFEEGGLEGLNESLCSGNIFDGNGAAGVNGALGGGAGSLIGGGLEIGIAGSQTLGGPAGTITELFRSLGTSFGIAAGEGGVNIGIPALRNLSRRRRQALMNPVIPANER